MKYIAVIRERGSAWNAAIPMREQKQWKDHAAFMDGLAAEGFIVLGGPWGEGERAFLLVFKAKTKQEVETRLEMDPWTRSGYLRIARIEPWEILLGR